MSFGDKNAGDRPRRQCLILHSSRTPVAAAEFKRWASTPSPHRLNFSSLWPPDNDRCFGVILGTDRPLELPLGET